MRTVRQPGMHPHSRALQTNNDALLVLELNSFISLSFDFNFGDESKELLFGVQFHYDSDDQISDS